MNFVTASSIVAATAATVGLGAALLSLLGFKSLSKSLLLGVSYGAGVVVAAKLIKLSSYLGFALSTSSWTIVALGLLAGIWTWQGGIFRRPRSEHGAASLNPSPTRSPGQSLLRDPLIIALLSLLLVHVSITLFNNFTRPIFPWDAFTTWMYRAKAWTLHDSITAMAYAPEWIAAGGEGGYAIYANDYPTALSIYAAFMAAVSGGWNEPAASVPWSLALIAACCVTHGSIVAAGLSQRMAVLGAYFLGSLPIVNIHASLAGYADLWMLLLSGSGLALLLLWRCVGEQKFMLLAAILLLAGTQIKTEGWLWLGLGGSFVAVESLADRFGYAKLLAAIGAGFSLIWLFDLTTLSLGPLGSWGVDQNGIQIGALGSYALRPYNPLGDYFRSIYLQANFLVLGTMYLFSVIVLAAAKAERAAAFWLMGGLIATSQGVIFGLSTFSQYAEVGTAITRILIHFLPVATLTCMMGWAAVKHGVELSKLRDNTNNASQRARPLETYALAITIALIAIASPVLFVLDASQHQVHASFNRNQLQPVAGRVAPSPEGLRFVDSPISVGVLSAPLARNGRVLPNYLKTDTSFEDTGDISFYWIPKGEAEVHSVPLAVDGYSITDLGKVEAWRRQPIREIGFLVQENAFKNSSIRGLELKQRLDRSDTTGLFNHWTSTEPLSHRLINRTKGHVDAPILLATWANAATLAVIVIILALLFVPLLSSALSTLGGALLVIWVSIDVATVNSAALRETKKSDPERALSYPAALEAEIIKSVERTVSERERVLIVTDDGSSQLLAQKLPYALLPVSAVFSNVQVVSERTIRSASKIVVLNEDKQRMRTLVKSYLLMRPELTLTSLDGAAILSTGAR